MIEDLDHVKSHTQLLGPETLPSLSRVSRDARAFLRIPSDTFGCFCLSARKGRLSARRKDRSCPARGAHAFADVCMLYVSPGRAVLACILQPGYLGGFYFYLDAIATFSLLFDIPAILIGESLPPVQLPPINST